MLHSRFIRRELTRSGRQAGVLVLCVALSVVSLVAVDGQVKVTLSRQTNLWHFPLEAVSNSEAGYERVYQGTCTLLWWAVPLEPHLPWNARLTLDLLDG